MWKNASRLFWVSILLALAACAPKRVEMPSFEGQDFRAYLTSLNGITNVETKMSIIFEKNEAEMRGDGILKIAKNGDMSLRVYSLGFLAMELTSEEGTVKSTPRLDRNKSLILTSGLRDCLFWWDMQNASLTADDAGFTLSSPNRTVWVDRKTFLPLRQKIWLENGRSLDVRYEEPVKKEDRWYPSRVTIELGPYRVIVTVKDVAFRSVPASS